MFEGLKSVIAFLTVFPVGKSNDSLQMTSKFMPLFPLVGLAIGGVSGLAYLLLDSLLPSTIAGFLTLGVILVITGLHHTDGLLDFGDGLMCKGSKEEKIEAMRDTMTGAGGFGIAVIVLVVTALSIASFSAISGGLAVACAETSAKASMVLAARIGKSASPGSNTQFIQAMHDRRSSLWLYLSIIFSFAIGFIFSGQKGILSNLGALLGMIVIVYISNRNFGGLTGDVFGAINDIARMVTLVILSVR